jgi:hypothetical protein
MSVAASISLYLIELLFDESPPVVEYYHKELPSSESSKETVLYPFFHENEYNNYSDLPNSNPKCPLSFIPYVFFLQIGTLETARGSNLNKRFPDS